MSEATEVPVFTTIERNLSVLLIWKGVEIVKRTRLGYKTAFHFNEAQAAPIVEDWRNGKPFPVDDIRRVFNAESIFNAAIHEDF